MKSKTFKCFATNAANSYARADVRETLKKRKEEEKEREREREKKTKDPTQRSRTKRFVFRHIYRCINFISV